MSYQQDNKGAGTTKNQHREPYRRRKAKRATNNERRKIFTPGDINMEDKIMKIWNLVKTNML